MGVFVTSAEESFSDELVLVVRETQSHHQRPVRPEIPTPDSDTHKSLPKIHNHDPVVMLSKVTVFVLSSRCFCCSSLANRIPYVVGRELSSVENTPGELTSRRTRVDGS